MVSVRNIFSFFIILLSSSLVVLLYVSTAQETSQLEVSWTIFLLTAFVVGLILKNIYKSSFKNLVYLIIASSITFFLIYKGIELSVSGLGGF